MKLLLVLIVCVNLLIASTEFEKAYEIYKKGDYEKSFVLFNSLANDGDSDAAYILGYMYEKGEGCEVDATLSARWYKASSKGYYNELRHDTSREIDKQKHDIYKTLEKSQDKETQNTIRQYTNSLYSIKAYKSNYFLPISYRDGGSYADTNGHESKDIETEFQVSLKFDFASNFFGIGEIYSIAYTQLSFWQLYSESAFFRETNYNPEIFMTIPLDAIGGTDFLKAVKLGFEHESNGRGGDEERSWNRVTSTLIFQYEAIFSELKLWYRVDNLNHKSRDYNPYLVDYLGYGHLKFILPYKKHLFDILFRYNFDSKGAVEAHYSYPVLGRDDLFLYLKGFSGYGESLIDYNHNVNKVGIGFSISR